LLNRPNAETRKQKLENGKREKGKAKLETRRQKKAKSNPAERFLAAQADPFAGAKGQEKIGLLRSE
jgi:hypothetical protein